MNKKGFALIELLAVCAFPVVIVVLSILDHNLVEYSINCIKSAQHKELVDVPWWLGVICVPVTPAVIFISILVIIASYFI